ncbi:hypothetical protein Pla123a_23380 [Posidoniimonas polymericola]|uniref:Uncharacterized protein n=2 Tax=Posidoniimonas polymericola TaxID=2528002 RepID=A0A5C5YPW6_9BACT|nr:hypothetical protein Pla123a_23380 [Posidoniimonas polymericola]
MGVNGFTTGVLIIVAISVASRQSARGEAPTVTPHHVGRGSPAEAVLSARVGSTVSAVLEYIKSQDLDPKENRGAYASPKGTDHVTIPLNPQTSFAIVGFETDAKRVDSISIYFHPEGSPQKAYRSYNAVSHLRLFEDGSYEVRFLPPTGAK